MNKMQNRKNGLTIDQKIFIKNNYKTMSNKEIGTILNIDAEKIRRYARSLKLKKEQYLIPKEKILTIFNKDYSYIYDNLLECVELKSEDLYKSKYGKYTINQNYFETIDNEWKAYWLGFLYADGCNKLKFNNKKNKMECVLKIALKSTDYKHLEKLKNSLQSDSPIKFRKVKLGEKTYENCEINFCNEKICRDLNKQGCVPNKSLTLKFPNENIVPKKYIRHFIRGYFDGDGCVHIDLNENKEHANRSFIINFVGTQDMINGIIDTIISDIGVKPVGYNLKNKGLYQKKDNKAYSCSYSNLFDVEKIFLYLYENSSICLDRKINTFKKLFN